MPIDPLKPPPRRQGPSYQGWEEDLPRYRQGRRRQEAQAQGPTRYDQAMGKLFGGWWTDDPQAWNRFERWRNTPSPRPGPPTPPTGAYARERFRRRRAAEQRLATQRGVNVPPEGITAGPIEGGFRTIADWTLPANIPDVAAELGLGAVGTGLYRGAIRPAWRWGRGTLGHMLRRGRRR